MQASLLIVLAFPMPLAAQLPPRSGTVGGTPIGAETPRAAPGPVSTVTDPRGFTATIRRGQVVLSWEEVPGVSRYLLSGPGLGLNGQEVQGTGYRVTGLGSGTYEWAVASLSGAGHGPINNWTRWPRARVTLEASNAGTDRYRITILGFRANRETGSDMAGHDAKSDEVYAAAYVRVMDRRSRGLLLEGVVQSNTQGGIRAGNLVPDALDPAKPNGRAEENSLPLLVWDGSLGEGGEVVLVTPTLWEREGGSSLFSAWKDARRQETSRILDDERVQQAIGVPGLAPTVLYPRSGAGIADGGQDRPIGLRWVKDGQEPSRDLPNRVIAITREKIERELAAPSRDAATFPGTIALEFEDDGESQGFRGKYTLYLRVERTP